MKVPDFFLDLSPQHGTPARKTPLDIDLKLVRIASPCPADWNKMAGDDRVRHCDQCDLNVYNLSSMTEREIKRLLAESTGRVCGRFYRRADGTMLTQDCPRGLRAEARRLWLAAATLVGALMTAGMAMGQSKEAFQGRVDSVQSENKKAGIVLEVMDPQGAVIAGAKVRFTNKDGKQKRTGTTNSNGLWQLRGLAAGEYVVEVEATNFTNFKKTVAIGQGKTARVKSEMKFDSKTVMVTVGELVSDEFYLPSRDDGSLGETITRQQIENMPRR